MGNSILTNTKNNYDVVGRYCIRHRYRQNNMILFRVINGDADNRERGK